MRRLFLIVQQFREYFLLALLVVASIALMTENDNRQIRRIRAIGIAVVGRVQETLSFVPNFFQLQKENEVLRQVNLNLADEVNQLREARLENLRLRRLLGFKETTRYEVIPAKVVGKSLYLLRNTITLDAGEKDGVRVGMPIVTDAGLVGKVLATSPAYSIGQIVLNRDFRASAKIQRSRVDGIIAWEGGRYSLMKNVPKTLDVKVGDIAETSEYSNTYPPGLRIGVVASVTQQPGSLFQRIEIENAVDFTTLEEVFVMKFQPDSARVQLELRARR